MSSVTARDSQDMLDRVSRSENESNSAYRRIEDQLKGVGSPSWKPPSAASPKTIAP